MSKAKVESAEAERPVPHFLGDSVAFAQGIIDKASSDPDSLREASAEVEAALKVWPTSPQLLDAQHVLSGLLEAVNG